MTDPFDLLLEVERLRDENARLRARLAVLEEWEAGHHASQARLVALARRVLELETDNERLLDSLIELTRYATELERRAATVRTENP